ncbi:MAG: hypothetical protein ACWA5Q_04775 [bacterium]
MNNTATKRSKQKYEAPRVLYRETLEAVAAGCNPGKMNTAACPAGPITS